jgi:outer membrane protein insertion porin family
MDTNFILSSDLYRIDADYFDFVRESTGGDLSLGYHVLEDVMATVGYTREYVSVQPGTNLNTLPLANRFRDGITSAARLTLSWDRRDNRLFPSQGFIHYLSVELAPPLLGGTFLFARYNAYSRLYFPLPFGLVFKTNASIGYIQSLDPNAPLPISELFKVGGINTVRGYRLRRLGPTVRVGASRTPETSIIDDFGIGGNKQTVFNVELEFPILEKVGIRGVLFYDAGNAFGENERLFQDLQNNVPLGLFHGVGLGFRWFSPIGPLRFEWGFPLNKLPGDEPSVFEFTIGNSF